MIPDRSFELYQMVPEIPCDLADAWARYVAALRPEWNQASLQATLADAVRAVIRDRDWGMKPEMAA